MKNVEVSLRVGEWEYLVECEVETGVGEDWRTRELTDVKIIEVKGFSPVEYKHWTEPAPMVAQEMTAMLSYLYDHNDKLGCELWDKAREAAGVTA